MFYLGTVEPHDFTIQYEQYFYHPNLKSRFVSKRLTSLQMLNFDLLVYESLEEVMFQRVL